MYEAYFRHILFFDLRQRKLRPPVHPDESCTAALLRVVKLAICIPILNIPLMLAGGHTCRPLCYDIVVDHRSPGSDRR
ncbi:unnamed protein product [Macrosiphum euphorbiae]|uniref:Uncharacterized protein n=1 Tax=Macrosiphum euphorbiae TaxID=13131 RepID=A0AAV0XWM0_9HEMI|nr:unnamed protein product [Macrosiphum euphorbiae]